MLYGDDLPGALNLGLTRQPGAHIMVNSALIGHLVGGCESSKGISRNTIIMDGLQDLDLRSPMAMTTIVLADDVMIDVCN